MHAQAPKVSTSERVFHSGAEVADARAWLTALLPIRAGIPDDTAAAAVLCLSEAMTAAMARTGAVVLSVSLGADWLYVEARPGESVCARAPWPRADADTQRYATALIDAFTNVWDRLPDDGGVYFYLRWP
ncbi:hypothetical protein ACFOVU_23760 [Nocardiopsis sediminis]|uniref:ATP-binding protein n=1 Tax=Nocardiopsis sediminis TaxID=1778267 RepID=A0ABV8FU58_9ACTN